MDGGLVEDEENIESQPGIAQGERDEQPAKGVSMVQRIPRVSGTNVHSTGAARLEARESDIAVAVKMVKAVEEALAYERKERDYHWTVLHVASAGRFAPAKEGN